jgi:hypothetical protein
MALMLRAVAQGTQEVTPVHVIEEGIIALVATAHHVTNGTGIPHSHLAQRGANSWANPEKGSSRNQK